jgi:hypothetical protein
MRSFIARLGIKDREAAKQNGVTPSMLSTWLGPKWNPSPLPRSRPKSSNRRRIERWSGGEVPESAWDTEEEREAVGRVLPANAS